jgi:hypothetical protein
MIDSIGDLFTRPMSSIYSSQIATQGNDMLVVDVMSSGEVVLT